MINQIVCAALLDDLDWTRECATLQKNLALGDAKHRRLVRDLYADVRQGLADCLYCLSAQSGLGKSDATRLIEHLARVRPGDANSGRPGALDGATLTLAMALTHALNLGAQAKVQHLMLARHFGER